MSIEFKKAQIASLEEMDPATPRRDEALFRLYAEVAAEEDAATLAAAAVAEVPVAPELLPAEIPAAELAAAVALDRREVACPTCGHPILR